MTETMDLNDEDLASLAKEWRRRALQGELTARGRAHALEAELRRRVGIPPRQTTLDTRPLAMRLRPLPWWRFW